MLRVSGPALVTAACNEGAIGAFPTKNARTAEELDAWLTEIRAGLKVGAAPFCPNLVMRDARRDQDVEVLARHGVEMVITSVGSPAAVMGPLHEMGALVLADVATLDHARKALAAGVDGLVLLTAGAGGHTGWMNPFAFVRAVRGFYDGPIVLAGGMMDGTAMAAARTLGCDLVYMGTRFIAAEESLADETYRAELIASEMDDIVLTKQFAGIVGNYLKPSIVAAGIDPARLDESVSEEAARRAFSGADPLGPRRWTDIRSAGHTVSGVKASATVAEIIAQTRAEYLEASR
jgi:nitronate monooxygenase